MTLIRPPPLLSSLPSLVVVVVLLVCSTAIDAFSMRVISPGVVTKRNNLLPNIHHNLHVESPAPSQQVKDRSSITSLYSASNDIDDEANSSISFSTSNTIYTPLDRPLLAIVDTISLIIFAAIGKSSHSADGSLDLLAVLITAFPFITAWMVTSPLTGVYSPDDRETNVMISTASKVAKGWVLAIPLGIALRGVIKGYVPPTPFIIVTLLSTLVILAGVRILFSVVEDC